MKRVILDTNVFISALLAPQAEKGLILDLWMNGAFVLLYSDYQFFEIREVATYPKLITRLKSARVETLITQIKTLGMEVSPYTTGLEPSIPDRKDMYLLSMAINGQAEYLVSSDKRHLLPLGKIEQTIVIDPTAFLAMLENS
jgi:uncharacterized protein